jgi:hypothetical protein
MKEDTNKREWQEKSSGEGSLHNIVDPENN